MKILGALDRKSTARFSSVIAGLVGIFLILGGAALYASHLTGVSATYTLDTDFDDGTLINVNHDPPNGDQLQLDDLATPFNFVWVAASQRGTVVKIDTNTGDILGEFYSTPASQSWGNPSRTTVDNDGSVWIANRNNVFGGFGSVLHIGLEENNQCEDRNFSGTIETSTGLGDLRAWTDPSGPRGVMTADDECIVHYTQVNSKGTRHVSVDANNNVWVGGFSVRNFDLIKGGRYDVPGSGGIIRSENSVLYGGYGGLIDGNGVIWSARNLLRWDTTNPLSGPNGDPGGESIGPPAAGTNWSGQTFDSYGLCIDSLGNVWNTQLYGNLIRKYAPDGAFLGKYPHGNNNAQGCVVDQNDDVWVAHALFGSTTVGHLLKDGTWVGNVPLLGGTSPTGVAVDANGKIWSANRGSSTVSRIDPLAGPIGGGEVRVGAVDLTVDLGANAFPYNYSDMTGSTLIAPPSSGTWTIVHDSGVVGAEWGLVSWNSLEPGNSSATVTAASSPDGISFGSAENVSSGSDLNVDDGQYLKVVVTFDRSTTTGADENGIGDSPILFDLTIASAIEVALDIKPGSCPNPLNVTKKGVVPVAIAGTADFDASQIDPASVRLEGVAPLRWAWGDVATPYEPFLGKVGGYDCHEATSDGYTDLTLKFDAQELVTALGVVADREVLVLSLTGNLLPAFGATPILGEDVMIALVNR